MNYNSYYLTPHCQVFSVTVKHGVSNETLFLIAFVSHPRKLQIWKPDTCAELISNEEMKLRIELVER